LNQSLRINFESGDECMKQKGRVSMGLNRGLVGIG
jgi:hypothetical protein